MADFDPDAYLNSGQAPAFDPDAYLGKPAAPKGPKESWFAREVVGPLEGVAHAASGFAAYPMGLAAAAGTYLNPLDRLRQHSVMSGPSLAYGSGNLDDQEAWRRAGQARQAVADQWTYTPRTQSGRASAGQWDDNMVTRGMQWAGDQAARAGAALNAAVGGNPGQQKMAGDIASEAAPLAAAELGIRGLKAVPKAAPALAKYAEKAAIRATNADRTALKRTFGRPLNEAALQETGRFMLDEKIPLRSPQAMQEGLADALANEGPAVGNTVRAASAAGAKVDLGAAAKKALADLKYLDQNTETRPIFKRVEEFLNDQQMQHGGRMDPVAAHQLRQQLDLLSKWERSPNMVDSTAAGAFRDVRTALNEQIDAAMKGAGLEAEWGRANAAYKNASRAKGLADVGVERRQGNRVGTPSEKAAALAGGLAAAAHNPLAGIAIPAATIGLNRGWWPGTARAADALSKALSAPAPAALTPAVRTAALAEAMRRMTPANAPTPGWPFVVTPAAASDGETP